MKNKNSLVKLCAYTTIAVLLIGVAFYAIAYDQLRYRVDVTGAVSAAGNVGELLAGDTVEQSFVTDDDRLRQISLLFQTYGRENTGKLIVSILEGSQTLCETTVDVSTLVDNAYTAIPTELFGVAGKMLIVRIVSVDGASGNAVTVAFGDSISTGRTDFAVDGIEPAYKNGATTPGTLCMTLTTVQTLWFGQYYWYFLAVAVAVIVGYQLHLLKCDRQGKSCAGLKFLSAMERYRFLLRQLVSRDFKTKYKRSLLGVFWSFLNPLLTMLVQYVVFSTLFKSDIPNYPVYLLTGIVCFSYFSESVNQCMVSITGNASLITKVYVPKYIYPLSKALSSGINMLLSLIPLLLVAIVTDLRIHPSILLLPLGLAFLFMFCLGMGMLLSTSMVFFRDTQFLWSVASMLWMYGTPIFYPESIIPESLMPIYKMNPLYHIIRFFRTILIDGVSPEPKAYLLSLIACAVPLIFGLLAFKKNQGKFVLHI